MGHWLHDEDPQPSHFIEKNAQQSDYVRYRERVIEHQVSAPSLAITGRSDTEMHIPHSFSGSPLNTESLRSFSGSGSDLHCYESGTDDGAEGHARASLTDRLVDDPKTSNGLSDSDISETSSVASRVFSNASAASSRSSLASEVHEGLFEQCVRAIIEVTAIKDICSDVVRSIDRARFERNIRRLLQDYAYHLRKSPRTQVEHGTIKYFRRLVPRVAETFTNTFYPPEHQQPTTGQKAKQRVEETSA